MASMWSPTSSQVSSSYFLSPLSPYDQNQSAAVAASQVASQKPTSGCVLPAPLLCSSPVNGGRRRTNSLMNNSLDLAAEVENTPATHPQSNERNLTATNYSNLSNDHCDSGFFNHYQQPTQQRQANYATHLLNSKMSGNASSSTPQFFLTPSETPQNSSASNSSASSAGDFLLPKPVATAGQFKSTLQLLHYRTEMLISGQQATPWNHFTVVSQLRKLVDLNLIDISVIKQDNPSREILTLVQKLVKYNLALDMIEAEDEQLRHELLTKLIKMRCEEVLAISGSIQEITERRQAYHAERNRIKTAMKEIAAEVELKSSQTKENKDVDKATVPNKPLISL